MSWSAVIDTSDLSRTRKKMKARNQNLCGIKDWMQSTGYSDHTQLLNIRCARRTSTYFKNSKVSMTFSHKRKGMRKLKVLI